MPSRRIASAGHVGEPAGRADGERLVPRQQRPIEVTEQPVRPAGQQQRGGPVEIVVARVGHHLLGLHECVRGRPSWSCARA